MASAHYDGFYDIQDEKKEGVIWSVSHYGHTVSANNMNGTCMYEVVRVGEQGLIGEVIRMEGDTATIQVYGEHTGLTVGQPVLRTHQALSVELGPGILCHTFDGVQRPLKEMSEDGSKIFLPRNAVIPPLNRQKKWEFTPHNFKVGDYITGGDVFGKVYETPLVIHWIMLPPKEKGTILFIAPAGSYTITEEVLAIEPITTPPITTPPIARQSFTMVHKWPVRHPRPYEEKQAGDTPLHTGIRVLDSLFPITQGGSVAIPGASGTGKGVICKTIAKYSNSDVVVYVNCGERGNEIAEMLLEFPQIKATRGQHNIMNRTCIVAHTSNMPLAGREAAVYTGVTIAEYFRDQGHNVTLIVDSTTRWVEAMQAITGSMNDLPASCGYPAYLAYRLSAFYERAAKVVCKGNSQRIGSLSIITSVSPPGGDFADVVTSATLSVCNAFWGLNAKQAQARRYPAVNFYISHSGASYRQLLPFFYSIGPEYADMVTKIRDILRLDEDLTEIIQLVGVDSLGETDKLAVHFAKLLKEDFLQQDLYSLHDKECPVYKRTWMMLIFCTFYDFAMKAIEGNVTCAVLFASRAKLMRKITEMKYMSCDNGREPVEAHMKELYASVLSSFNIYHIT